MCVTDFHDLRQVNLHSFTFKLQAGEMANAEIHKEGLMVVLKYKDKLRKHKSKIIGEFTIPKEILKERFCNSVIDANRMNSMELIP